MLARFDHAVIAVADLDAAVATYRRIGFDVAAGGRHVGLGTHNAIARFGLDYLELLAVEDEQLALAAGPSRAQIVEFIHRHRGGLIGYALATSEIEADAARLRLAGQVATGPSAMHRKRPDGSILSWRVLLPGGTGWRRPWPFIIQWDQPDNARQAIEGRLTHPNGIHGVAGVTVAVRDLDGAIDVYGSQLGLGAGQIDDVAALGARRAIFAIGAFRIELLSPAAGGPIQQELDQRGEGLYDVLLETSDMAQTRAALVRAGVTPLRVEGDTGHTWIRIPPEAAEGARFVVVERRDVS